MWMEVELKGWYGSVDGGRMWNGIVGIRERLTPGPLTLLSLSPRIEVSHFGLSLLENS